jgi:trehalose-phosphatase
MTSQGSREQARLGRAVGPRRRRAPGQAALEAFFAKAARSPSRVLLTDYDGTLVPFRANRDSIAPYPGVPEAVSDLQRQGRTRLVIVSGRPIADLQSRLSWLRPRPELWGSHGVERLTVEGRLVAPPVPLPLADLLDRVESWMGGRGSEALFERKTYGFALHERPDPERFSEAQRALLAEWGASCERRRLERIPFDGGIEFRLFGINKGRAVATILAEEGPEAAMAYLGDDTTDEDAFEALEGLGLAVLVRRRRRPTRAEVWLQPPEELLRFLSRWNRGARDGVPLAETRSTR